VRTLKSTLLWDTVLQSRLPLSNKHCGTRKHSSPPKSAPKQGLKKYTLQYSMIKYLCLSLSLNPKHTVPAPPAPLVAGGRVIQCHELSNSRQSARIQSQEKARRDAVNQTSPPNQRGADLVGFQKRNTQNDNCETFKPTEFRVTLSLFNTVPCCAKKISKQFQPHYPVHPKEF